MRTSTFPAKYNGRCPMCKGRIKVGDIIIALQTNKFRKEFYHSKCGELVKEINEDGDY